MPDFSHEIYSVDPERAALYNKMKNDLIECHEERARSYLCISRYDNRKIYCGILACEKWGPLPKGCL